MKNKQEREEQIYTEKLQVAQQTKEERAEIEKSLMEYRLLSRKEALENKEAIRLQQDEARRKLEQLKLSKLQQASHHQPCTLIYIYYSPHSPLPSPPLNLPPLFPPSLTPLAFSLAQAQEEYERRLKEEMDAKAAKEREIEQLAKLEMELIERLKAKQQEQKKALQQLEAVLAIGSPSSPKGTMAKKTQALSPKSTTKAKTGGATAKKSSSKGEPTEEDVARAFAVYDREGTGSISTKDIPPLLKDLHVPLGPEQLDQAVSQLDPNKTKKVSFGEFLLWWKG